MNLPRFLLRLFLGRRLPITRGSLRISAIRDNVTIRRDQWGIAYIDAGNDWDAWFGLGFCHGQDRSFQLETILRASRGTLAELVGLACLPIDRLARRVGFHHAAQLQLNALAPEVLEMFESYAAGVSAGASRGLRRRAHEFALLRASPTGWTACDVLAFLKLQSFVLASNWDVELARWRLLVADGPEAVAALHPGFPEWQCVTSPPDTLAGNAAERLAEDLALFTAATGLGGGSNNWTLAPSRTATGRPILANDPHLNAALPSHWYLAHLRTPQWSVAGTSFIGIPGIPAGHNGFCAWGVTAGLVDNTDLFLEQLGPDGRSIRQGDQFVPCSIRTEEIKVKGDSTVKEEVLITPRGPIISPALDGEQQAMSLRATWLDPEPLQGLFALHRVRSFPEFRRALSQWPLGSMNMVYADVKGVIGWQLAGTAPRRRQGWGALPRAGADPANGWEDSPVPFEEMPYLVHPSPEDPSAPVVDYLATANNQPLPEGQGPYLGMDWMDGYRQSILAEVLRERRDWNVARTMTLQCDQRSRPWQEVREMVVSLSTEEPNARQALEILLSWNGVVGADSPGAAIYELFVAEMVLRLGRVKAPRGFEWALGKGHSSLTPINFLGHRRVGHLVRLLQTQPEGWFTRSWQEEMTDALSAVVQRLHQSFGPESSAWAWGRIRTLTMHHALGQRPWLARIFNLGPIPCGGDNDTVAQASVLPLMPLAEADNIASARSVIDVGAWEESRFVLPGGQSGNPFSPHYGDLFPLWQRGEGVPIAWTPERIEQVTREVLQLGKDERKKGTADERG